MLLPDRERAWVPPSKLTLYLLSETHPVGRGKAQFFRGVGYDEQHLPELEQDLLSLARREEVAEMVPSMHGTKYVIEGEVVTPTGRRVYIRTIWIVEPGGQGPRFVSAYPQ